MNEHKHPLEVFWDEGSEAFVCTAPDLPGCSAIGDTPQEALREMDTAMRLWIQAAVSLGRELPLPSRKAA